MVNPNLLAYVKQELNRGVSKEQLKVVLVQNKWPEEEVEEAIRQVEVKSVPVKESEEVLKSIVEEFEKKEPVVEKKFLTSIEEPLLTLESKQPQPQTQPVSVERTPVTVERKTPPFKYLIVGLVVFMLIGLSFYFYFSFYKGATEGYETPAISVDKQAELLALSFCNKYCKEGKCELFKNPSFSAAGLRDKNCSDLEVECSKCA